MPVATPPDLRVPYDLDGTVVTLYNLTSGTFSNLSQSVKADLNDNNYGVAIHLDDNTPGRYLIWLFDRPMTITALWAIVERGPGIIGSVLASAWGYSTNTTNGVDGSWTYIAGVSSTNISNLTWAAHGVQRPGAVEPSVRSSPYVFGTPLTGIKGLRIYLQPPGANDCWYSNAAIYGHPEERPWLEFWDPVDDEPVEVPDVDWGFHDRGTVDVKQFRIKNCHDDNTINGVTVTVSDISSDSPKAGDSTTLSLDDAVYGSSVSLGDLAPGEISAPFYVRRSTPANAVLGIYDLRLVPSFTAITE